MIDYKKTALFSLGAPLYSTVTMSAGRKLEKDGSIKAFAFNLFANWNFKESWKLGALLGATATLDYALCQIILPRYGKEKFEIVSLEEDENKNVYEGSKKTYTKNSPQWLRACIRTVSIAIAVGITICFLKDPKKNARPILACASWDLIGTWIDVVKAGGTGTQIIGDGSPIGGQYCNYFEPNTYFTYLLGLVIVAAAYVKQVKDTTIEVSTPNSETQKKRLTSFHLQGKPVAVGDRSLPDTSPYKDTHTIAFIDGKPYLIPKDKVELSANYNDIIAFKKQTSHYNNYMNSAFKFINVAINYYIIF